MGKAARTSFVLLLLIIGINVNAQHFAKAVHYCAANNMIYELKAKDSVIRMFDADNGSFVKQLMGAGKIENMKVSHSGRTVVAFGEDVFIWRFPDTLATLLPLDATKVRDIGFLPNEQQFVIAAYKGLHLVEGSTIKTSVAVELAKSPFAIEISADGTVAVAPRPTGGFYILDLVNFGLIASTDSRGAYNTVRFLAGNRFFYHNAVWNSGGRDKAFSLSAPTIMSGIKTMISTGKNDLLIGSLYDTYMYEGYNNRIGIWNAENGQLVHAINAHANYINSLALSDDEKLLVSVSSDKTAAVWKMDERKLIKRVTLPAEGQNVFITKDNKRMIIQLYNAPVQVWSIEEGSLLYEIK